MNRLDANGRRSIFANIGQQFAQELEQDSDPKQRSESAEDIETTKRVVSQKSPNRLVRLFDRYNKRKPKKPSSPNGQVYQAEEEGSAYSSSNESISTSHEDASQQYVRAIDSILGSNQKPRRPSTTLEEGHHSQQLSQFREGDHSKRSSSVEDGRHSEQPSSTFQYQTSNQNYSEQGGPSEDDHGQHYEDEQTDDKSLPRHSQDRLPSSGRGGGSSLAPSPLAGDGGGGGPPAPGVPGGVLPPAPPPARRGPGPRRLGAAAAGPKGSAPPSDRASSSWGAGATPPSDDRPYSRSSQQGRGRGRGLGLGGPAPPRLGGRLGREPSLKEGEEEEGGEGEGEGEDDLLEVAQTPFDHLDENPYQGRADPLRASLEHGWRLDANLALEDEAAGRGVNDSGFGPPAANKDRWSIQTNEDDYDFALLLRPREDYKRAIEAQLAAAAADGGGHTFQESFKRNSSRHRIEPPPNDLSFHSTPGIKDGPDLSYLGIKRMGTEDLTEFNLTPNGTPLTAAQKTQLQLYKRFLKAMSQGAPFRWHRARRPGRGARLYLAHAKGAVVWRAHAADGRGRGAHRGPFDPAASAGPHPVVKEQSGVHFSRKKKDKYEGGTFSMDSIVAVHPANREDPTCPGYYGTKAIRLSADIANKERTFSLVCLEPDGDVRTLDVECGTDDLYRLLYTGFVMMKIQQTHQAATQGKSPEKRSVMQKLGKMFKASMTYSMDPAAASADAAPRPRAASHELLSAKDYNYLGRTPGAAVLERLENAGLKVKRVVGVERTSVLLKIKIPQARLEQAAEGYGVKLKMKDGTMARYKASLRGGVSTLDGQMFRSSDRQKVLDVVIRSPVREGGAGLDPRGGLGVYLAGGAPLHSRSRLAELRAALLFGWRGDLRDDKHSLTLKWPGGKVGQEMTRVKSTGSMVSRQKSMTQATSVAEMDDLKGQDGGDCNCFGFLLGKMKNGITGVFSMPLDLIVSYFGETITWYFAWTLFYTRWLIIPGLVGLGVFALQIQRRQVLLRWSPLFSIFMTIWASLLIAYWRQYNSRLAHAWGVLHYEGAEVTRPEFRTWSKKDKKTGDMIYYPPPPIIRKLKYLLTYPIIFLAVLVALGIMVIIFQGRDQLLVEEIEEQSGTSKLNLSTLSLSDYGFWGTLLFYPAVYGVLIPVLTAAFQRLARGLNRFENYRRESEYRNHFIVKVFSFKCVVVYSSLYYYAFTTGDTDFAMIRLAATLLVYMTLTHWWITFLHVSAARWWKKMQFQKIRKKAIKLMTEWESEERYEFHDRPKSRLQRLKKQLMRDANSKVWTELSLGKFDLFHNYTVMAVQFGYVLFFSMVFPLAPFVALITNLIQVRVDAYHLVATSQRPIAQKASGVGVWLNVLQLMVVVATITNCAIFGLHSSQLLDLLPKITPVQQVLIIVAIEHLILGATYLALSAVHPVAPAVRRALAGAARDLQRKQRRKRVSDTMRLNPVTEEKDWDTQTEQRLAGIRRRRREKRGFSDGVLGLKDAEEDTGFDIGERSWKTSLHSPSQQKTGVKPAHLAIDDNDEVPSNDSENITVETPLFRRKQEGGLDNDTNAVAQDIEDLDAFIDADVDKCFSEADEEMLRGSPRISSKYYCEGDVDIDEEDCHVAPMHEIYKNDRNDDHPPPSPDVEDPDPIALH